MEINFDEIDNCINKMIDNIYKLYPFVEFKKILNRANETVEIKINFFYKSENYSTSLVSTPEILDFYEPKIKYFEDEIIKKIQEVISEDRKKELNLEEIYFDPWKKIESDIENHIKNSTEYKKLTLADRIIKTWSLVLDDLNFEYHRNFNNPEQKGYERGIEFAIRSLNYYINREK